MFTQGWLSYFNNLRLAELTRTNRLLSIKVKFFVNNYSIINNKKMYRIAIRIQCTSLIKPLIIFSWSYAFVCGHTVQIKSGITEKDIYKNNYVIVARI